MFVGGSDDFVCRRQLWHQWSLLSAFSRVFFHRRPLQRLSLWALTLVAASALALFVVVCDKIPMASFISVDFCDGFVHWRRSLFIYVSWRLRSLPAASALASSVCIGFGGGFSIGFVLLRWLCLPVAAVAIMTVCVDFQGLRGNNCVSILSS